MEGCQLPAAYVLRSRDAGPTKISIAHRVFLGIAHNINALPSTKRNFLKNSEKIKHNMNRMKNTHILK